MLPETEWEVAQCIRAQHDPPSFVGHHGQMEPVLPDHGCVAAPPVPHFGEQACRGGLLVARTVRITHSEDHAPHWPVRLLGVRNRGRGTRLPPYTEVFEADLTSDKMGEPRKTCRNPGPRQGQSLGIGIVHA